MTATSHSIMVADFSNLELKSMAFMEEDALVELQKQANIVDDLYRKAMACDRGSEEFMNLYGSYRRAEEHLKDMQKAVLNTWGAR